MYSGKHVAFGPGQAELLAALENTGSLTEAAVQLGMSYMRAWPLVKSINRSFRKQVVKTMRGGVKGGGGTRLTPTGREVLALYRQMDAKSLAVIQPGWLQLRKLLRHPGRRERGWSLGTKFKISK